MSDKVYAIYFNGHPHPTKKKDPLVYKTKSLAYEWLKKKKDSLEKEGDFCECKSFDENVYSYIYEHISDDYHAFCEYRIIEIPVRDEL